jgi:hypothetical protein
MDLDGIRFEGLILRSRGSGVELARVEESGV